jgi:hypothetical protein
MTSEMSKSLVLLLENTQLSEAAFFLSTTHTNCIDGTYTIRYVLFITAADTR